MASVDPGLGLLRPRRLLRYHLSVQVSERFRYDVRGKSRVEPSSRPSGDSRVMLGL
jgi:hypothetical protein